MGLAALVANDQPRGPMSLRMRKREATRLAPSEVARVITCGSGTPFSTAWSSHCANSSTGSSGAEAGSKEGISPANTGIVRSLSRMGPPTAPSACADSPPLGMGST